VVSVSSPTANTTEHPVTSTIPSLSSTPTVHPLETIPPTSSPVFRYSATFTQATQTDSVVVAPDT
ncbi:hypothetical protein ScPMuIL_006982, partial [Solemya velum]